MAICLTRTFASPNTRYTGPNHIFSIDKENRSAGVIKIERGTRGIGLEDETFWFLHILRPDTDIRVNGALFHFAGSARIRPLPDFATLEYHDQAHFIFTGLAGLHSSPQQAV